MPAVSKIPEKKRATARRSEPKLFRCTGFGNCDMVFTRSEHLARHARKHTGEKPFKCVVPNCDRMFSRFDNMMQHTHTHSRTRKKDSSDSSSEGKSSPISVPELIHVPSMDEQYTMDHNSRSPKHKSMYPSQMYYQQPHPQHPPSPTSQQEEEYVKYQQQHYYTAYNGSLNQQQNSQRYYESQLHWAPNYYTPSSPPQFHQSAVIAPSPYPSQHSMSSFSHHSTYSQSPPRSPANSVPPMSDYYGNYPSTQRKQQQQQQQQQYHHHQYYGRKNSIHSETNHQLTKRRLSYVDLSTPIQQLGTHSAPSSTVSETTDDDYDDDRQMSPLSAAVGEEGSRFKLEGIDITADEYEALQGFGKFCSKPVVREPMLMTRITTSPSCSLSLPIKLSPLRHVSTTAALSNNTSLASQVHAFRQQIPTVQESFKRSYV